MRLFVVVFTLLVASSATAEPQRTTENVTLRKKPGEKEAAIAQVPANTAVTVLAEEGRWLKVKINGVVGYITRTTVTAIEPTAATTTVGGGWSSGRRTGDGQEITDLFVEAQSAGPLAAEPKPDAAKVADIAKGAHLIVVDANTPGWIHARDDQGHEGWIERSHVENGATRVIIAGAGVDLQGSVTETFNRSAPPPFAIRAELGFGYRSLGMDLTSNSEGGLTNYLVDADAAAAVLDVDVIQRFGTRWFVAGDARVVASESSPGIDYPGPTGPPGKIPFSTFSTDVGVRAGLHAKEAFDLALRVGGHYDAFLPKDVDNVGMLPRERLLGLAVGARAEIAPPHSPIDATLRFDVLAIGSRAQTPGLEDGTSSSAHAVWGGITVRYQLAHHLSPFAGYEFGRATTSWSGMSEREPSVTDAHRVDTTQLVQLGVSAEL